MAAGTSRANGVFNVATDDWQSAADIARLAGGRVIRLPRALLVGASEAIFRLGLLPFCEVEFDVVGDSVRIRKRRVGTTRKKSRGQLLLELFR